MTVEGELTITKNEASSEAKEYFIVAVPKGKSVNGPYPKVGIKIQAECDDEKIAAKESTTYKFKYDRPEGNKEIKKDIDFATVQGWFEITNDKGTVNDKCKVESYTLVDKNGNYLPDLSGHSGYKVAEPTSFLETDKKPLTVNLEQKVDNF